jgi:peroxiredoxin family protein
MASRTEQHLTAMDATALVAQLRALNDAGGSYDEQAQCCTNLHFLGGARMPNGAAAEDAVRAVVAALSRGVQHAMLQVSGCSALVTLVRAAPVTGATTAGAVAAVLATLRAHPDSAGVQSTACSALAELFAHDSMKCATADITAIISAVVAAMTRHATDEYVAVYGCSTLASLTQWHPQAELTADAVSAVLAAMRAFPAVLEVQLKGCFVLGKVQTWLGLGGTRADVAPFDAAISAMWKFPGDKMVQVFGCAVLVNIFCDDKNADDAWVQRGAAALSAVTGTLLAHKEDVDVLSACCLTITRVMLCTKSNKLAAGISGAIEAVVAALRALPAAARLQQRGLEALSHMCQDVRDNQLKAAAAGGIEATLSALRVHTSDAGVQIAGCSTLRDLIADVPISQARAGAVGGVEVLVASMRACAVPLPPERVELFVRGCDAMSWLLDEHPINTHKAVAAGAIELLVAHLRNMPSGGDASVLDTCYPLLAHLLIGTGHAARAVLAGAMEALEVQHAAENPVIETFRLKLIDDLQPAAQRHDAAPCAVAGCQRCAAARSSGAMCALPSCGARRRDGAAAKKLLRCGTCRAACYCGPSHQREDWGRHKGECGAPPLRDADEQAAGASGA